MEPILKRWSDLSISRKLYCVVGAMGFLILLELLTLRFAMNNLSAVRAFVGGEGLWSKAQKNAIYYIQRYALTKNQNYYLAFKESLKIPEGDRLARLELEKTAPNLVIVKRGFIQGQLHPDDIDSMVNLLRQFYWVDFISDALATWKEGDRLLEELTKEGENFHTIIKGSQDPKELQKVLDRIDELNTLLTQIEVNFSSILGRGSRFLEHLVFYVLFIVVITVEAFGLALTFLTTRRISQGLGELNSAALRLGQGDFSYRLENCSKDEIGRLAGSVNNMGNLLQKSYDDLEKKVELRTIALFQVAIENERLYEEASLALKTRDEFLSMASHELKTPITALHLNLQMIERQMKAEQNVGTEKYEKHLENALKISKKLASLHEIVMDFTKIRMGKLELIKSEVDIVVIVREAISQVTFEAQDRGVDITLVGEEKAFLLGDPIRIGQVVSNLLINGIKYGEGSPITVSVLTRDQNIYVSVKDTGPGIPSEKQEMIFERFERGGVSHNVSGLGIGLFIAKQIVEAHQGTISVESKVGKGATFTIKLST